CNYPVREGIEVKTHSERVIQLRRILVELLVARCPTVPYIQNLAKELGVEKSRFKANPQGNDCILCGLCIRTCRELVGAEAISFSKRGTLKKVSIPFEVNSDQCLACGACEYICPTGAIKMEMDRIRKMKLSDTGTKRYCRYMRLGLVDFMLCSNGFECWRCEVDQRMEDQFETHPVFALKPGRRKHPLLIKGFHFYPELFYSEGHLWAKPLDQWIRLGLNEMASTFTLEADSVRLPPPGILIEKNQPLAEIISKDKKVEILSPISGTVSAINREVEEFPDLVWRDPYRRGWLIMLQPNDPEEISELHSGEKARTWFTKQAENLSRFLSKGSSRLPKNGGALDAQWLKDFVRNKFNQLKEILWKKEKSLSPERG
ncbi:MAG: 4Fe-4S dicluster domain-containing protein, partial [Thermodesulfobacteriota bacterium]